MTRAFTTADADRLLELADQRLKDWAEDAIQAGERDEVYEERHAEWQAIRPLLVAAPKLRDSCVWVQSKLFEIMDQHEARSSQWKALQKLAFHHQAALAKVKAGGSTTKPTCADRAEWAKNAVCVYARAKEGREYDPIEEMAADLFSDLCHLFVREGLSPEQMMERAQRHYQEECAEEGIII